MHRRRLAGLALIGILSMTPPTTTFLAADDIARLHEMFREEWEYTLRDDPFFASLLGDDRYGDRWRDLSPAAFEAREAHARDMLRRIEDIEPAKLSEKDRIHYRIFRRRFEEDLAEAPFRLHLLPVNHMYGIQNLTEQVMSLPFRSVKDYEDWLARMETFSDHMDQTIELMRDGMRVRMIHPRVIMERVPDQIAAQIVEDPDRSGFFEPFRRFPRSVDAAERQRLAQRARAVIREKVVPAYRRFLSFFEEEYLPACADEVGALRWPRGEELYAVLARRYTTTGMTPRQIHEIGLKEVARIRAEMEATIERSGFEGTFEEFFEFLRTDPRFYLDSPGELLKEYRALTRRIDPALVKLFRTLPRMPYGVEPIPEEIAPDTTTAYYREPAADGSRAGTYFVNLYRPEVRPTYEMEALSLHEAVPGHHLQIALAMELEDLPEFRRYTGFTAFVEGWALYAESLGEELGFYRDPYSKFGQLTYEMWRAVRLVVDTGLHALGWTRRRAIAYFMENAAKAEHDIVNEIDRYIAWPGQALAYKIGELRIKELRARAESELGGAFDVRGFHDTVLEGGAVPLDILESNIEAWIASRRRTAGN